MTKGTVVLAFSGGLDTSFAVLYLRKKGYDVTTVTVNTGGFSGRQMKEIGKRARELGSCRHYSINCEREFFDRLISRVIKANALYDGQYPLLCADRYIIAQKVAEVARRERAEAVAHGSTAMGNDQIRFDSAFASLVPEMRVVSPIKEAMLSREKEAEFLARNGHPAGRKSRRYSINENIMGRTVSGSEIDDYEEPAPEAYELTRATKTEPRKVTVTLERGIPVKIDQKRMEGGQLLNVLGKIAGGYGWGTGIYSGNCIIGIKGRILFEAPGLLAWMEAHKALEQITLTKAQMNLSSLIRVAYADHLYNGLYFDPAVKDMEAFFDSVQMRVSGEVVLKLEPNRLSVVSLKSPNSLLDRSIANYAQSCSWTALEADGFIKLFTLQERLSNKRISDKAGRRAPTACSRCDASQLVERRIVPQLWSFAPHLESCKVRRPCRSSGVSAHSAVNSQLGIVAQACSTARTGCPLADALPIGSNGVSNPVGNKRKVG